MRPIYRLSDWDADVIYGRVEYIGLDLLFERVEQCEGGPPGPKGDIKSKGMQGRMVKDKVDFEFDLIE